MESHEYTLMYECETHLWWYRGLHELLVALVSRLPGSAAGSLEMFDAGCGTGRTAEVLAMFGRVTGIDYAHEAIDYCRRRGLTGLQQGDLNTWPFSDSRYDLIVSLDVLSVRGITDDLAVLDRMYRALKPGGRLILNLPAFPAIYRQHDRAVANVRRYRRSTIRPELERMGFVVDYAGYRLPLLFLIIVAQKIGQALSGPASAIVSDVKMPAPWINTLFFGMNRLENLGIRAGLRYPFGSSLLLVCRKSFDRITGPAARGRP
jgi:SAM-dependent methyltransferase